MEGMHFREDYNSSIFQPAAGVCSVLFGEKEISHTHMATLGGLI